MNDDRTYYLLVALISSTVGVTVLAGLLRFDIPAGFWGVATGILTLLISLRRGTNNNGGHS